MYMNYISKLLQKKKNKPVEPDGSQGPLPPWPAMIFYSILDEIGKT